MIGLEALTTCFVQTRITHRQGKCCQKKKKKKKADLNCAMQCLLALVSVEIQALVQFRL